MSEPRFVGWGAWEPVLALAFREIRDFFRDWRLVFPIVTLTLLFPVVATLTAQAVFDFMNRYGGNLIFRQANPFLLLVVGFFPITFSLVIALETFVGEKERRSLEPLLATPLSDGQLYLGKMVASLIPPLAGSYLGMGTYLLGLYLFQGWIPPLSLLAQVLALTTAEALVMVSGAVVVSSQTTSVRAANLLASFIILPMAFLIQAEAVVMFWGRYATLWWILAFLLLCNVLLVRMGTRLFNREELLGREIDVVDVRRLWRAFRRYLAWDWWWFGRPPRALPRSFRWLGWLAGLYLRELPAVLGRSRGGLAVGLASAVGAVALGWSIALRYPTPFSLGRPGPSFLGGVTAGFVLANNLRALAVGTLLGVFSFGVLSVAPLLGEVIRRVHEGRSVGEVFQRYHKYR